MFYDLPKDCEAGNKKSSLDSIACRTSLLFWNMQNIYHRALKYYAFTIIVYRHIQ